MHQAHGTRSIVNGDFVYLDHNATTPVRAEALAATAVALVHTGVL